MARSGGSRTRMKKPCDCCKRYLDHLEQKNQNVSCFLGHMTANFKHSMVVPNRFMKQFGGRLSGTIKLESPNGNVYDVEVSEHLNKLMLRHGWEAFVDANHIEENDFLIFRHIEKSHFEVLIFDTDGCEKVFSCAGLRNTPCVQERSVDSVGISSSSCHDTTESSGSERSARSEKSGSSNHGKTAKMAATFSSSEESEGTPVENELSESDDIQTRPVADYVLARRSYLSKAQMERVTAIIQKIQPEIPVFVAVMQKRNVQPLGRLVICKEYAISHFPRETMYITLQSPDKSKEWHSRYYIRKDKSTYILRGQWFNFIRDNHVQEGDICLFLPTKSRRKFKLTIYLLRATATNSKGGTVSRTCFQRPDPCHARSSGKIASAGDVKEESTDGEHVSWESDMNEISGGPPNSKDSGGHPEPSYILPGTSGLSRSQKKIIEAKVRAIKSEVPIYIAIMRKTNTAVAKLEFGTEYAAAHLPAREQTMVLQCKRKIWKAKMKVSSRHRRFLGRGWTTFVRDNGLQVGDLSLFELKKNERKLTMEVHIISREQL
ncbi:B3 domain-containing protein Os03g0619600-like [Miscanthus floridulus]|uniref:B3 domain-containing protein Os03g0619600-like n=1 Tax=Miscanthus floridulus TaxID=154761 RepID=UPI003457C82C